MGRAALLAALVVANPAAASAADQALADAAQRGEWDVVRALVARGADVTARQGDGATALHWAAYRDEREVADLLIRAGADVNAGQRSRRHAAVGGLRERQRRAGCSGCSTPARTRTRRCCR